MADDIIGELDGESEDSKNKESRSQNRIRQLSEKVELTSKERDELKTLRVEDQKKIAELERENAFNSGFSDMVGTYPVAKDHKDDIKAKVLSGYSVEDAVFAVLGKAGKLATGTDSPKPQVVGGSADTSHMGGDKGVKDMTQAERREALSKELIWN